MVLLRQMTVMLIYMCVGYGLSKKGVLDDRDGKKLGWIVLNVANPALIISGVVGGGGRISSRELLATTVTAVLMFVFLIILGQVIPRTIRADRSQYGVYNGMTVFSNLGYMGFPIILSAYGHEATLYAVVFLILFNLLSYTYGIMIFSENQGKITISKMVNTGVVSSVLALVIFLFEIPAPYVIRKASEGLGGLTGPLSMMVIGMSLRDIKAKDFYSDIRLLIFCLCKMLIIPIAWMTAWGRFAGGEMLKNVVLIMVSTPVAAITVVFAQQFENNEALVSKGVALTSLMAVMTIPVVSLIV